MLKRWLVIEQCVFYNKGMPNLIKLQPLWWDCKEWQYTNKWIITLEAYSACNSISHCKNVNHLS